MRDQNKTKRELLNELGELRQRLALYEAESSAKPEPRSCEQALSITRRCEWQSPTYETGSYEADTANLSLDDCHRLMHDLHVHQIELEMRLFACLLERWDHPDGRYKLVAYKGGGLYMCEDVNDPLWKEIIDLIYGDDESPIPLFSEDWFELEIITDHADAFGTSAQMSSEQIPTTFAEWEKFVRRYVVEH